MFPTNLLKLINIFEDFKFCPFVGVSSSSQSVRRYEVAPLGDGVTESDASTGIYSFVS